MVSPLCSRCCRLQLFLEPTNSEAPLNLEAHEGDIFRRGYQQFPNFLAYSSLKSTLCKHHATQIRIFPGKKDETCGFDSTAKTRAQMFESIWLNKKNDHPISHPLSDKKFFPKLFLLNPIFRHLDQQKPWDVHKRTSHSNDRSLSQGYTPRSSFSARNSTPLNVKK